jgi:hypothetical protein
MDSRTSTLETDVAETRARLEAMQTNYATCVALMAVEGRLELKIESSAHALARQFDARCSELAVQGESSTHALARQFDARCHELALQGESVKNGLDLKIEMTRQCLSHQIDVTKYDLEKKIDGLALQTSRDYVAVRNWLLGTVISMFVGFGGLGATMYRYLSP